MKDTKLRADLERSVGRMIAMRQQYGTSVTPLGEGWRRGIVAGLELALHALHSYTGGEFGADLVNEPIKPDPAVNGCTCDPTTLALCAVCAATHTAARDYVTFAREVLES